jgi:hypothetical protein
MKLLIKTVIITEIGVFWLTITISRITIKQILNKGDDSNEESNYRYAMLFIICFFNLVY